MLKARIFIISVFVLVLVFVTVGGAAGPRIDWYPEPKTDEELNQSVTYKNLQIYNTGKELFFLSYYHNALFDDGTVMYNQFFIHNLGRGSNHPSADLTIIEPNGAVHRRIENLPRTALEYAPDRFRITFGSFSVGGDPSARPAAYRLKSRFDDDFGVDLTYTCEAPPFLDKGVYFNGDKNDYQRWVTYCPRAAVEGEITVGGKVRKVKGRGFADHAATNASLSTGRPALSDIGIYIRGSTPDFGFSLMEYKSLAERKGIEMPGILVNIGNRNVLFTRKYNLDIDRWAEKGGTKFPTVFRLSIDNPTLRLRGEIKMERYLLSGSIFDAVKSKTLRFLLEKIAGDPKWARFVCRWKFDYNYEGKKHSAEGKSITQVMLSG